MQFFKPDGTPLHDKNEFVDYYSKKYYLDSETVKSSNGKPVAKNSQFIEDEIDKLLLSGIQDANDIIRIIAWKTGKIKHSDSEKNKKFIFHSDWSIDEQNKAYDIMRYGNSFDISRLATFIVSNIDSLYKQSKNEPQEVINELKNHSPNGIGTVYLITLLYFISRGQYPICDRFAKMAIDAVLTDKRPNESVHYSELPNKNDKDFSKVIDIYTEEYVEKLEEVFGDHYKSNRDIDRALWVYGHLFNSNKSEC